MGLFGEEEVKKKKKTKSIQTKKEANDWGNRPSFWRNSA